MRTTIDFQARRSRTPDPEILDAQLCGGARDSNLLLQGFQVLVLSYYQLSSIHQRRIEARQRKV